LGIFNVKANVSTSGSKKIMNKFIISPKSRKNVKVVNSKLGENAGAIGAAALFYE